DDRPQLRRGAAGDRFAAAHGAAQGGDAGQLAPGRGRHHRRVGHRRRGAQEVPGRLACAQALSAHRGAAEMTRRALSLLAWWHTRADRRVARDRVGSATAMTELWLAATWGGG